MKLELKENMYVRTKKGNIYKFETNNSMAKNGAKKYMVNCSYNIIDLIEVGDYVNGSKVTTIYVDYDTYINTERVVNTLTLEDLNYDGTTVVDIVNDTVYEGNSDRKIFAISNIELISKN